MTTYYDLIKKLAYRIGDVRTSVATGGSTTTLIDTSLIEPNDYYNGGTLLIDQATPVTPRITDFASATFTFTFAAIGTAVVAGINYTAIHNRFPLDVLKRSINQAIDESEKIMAVSEDITLVASQERYALPAGVTEDIRRVEIGTEDSNDWKIHYAWTIEDGELRFLDWPPDDTSKVCRVHYVKQHAQLSALTDELDEKVNENRLIVNACKHALTWRNFKVGRDEPNTTELLNYYINLDQKLSRERVSQLLSRDPILARY